MRIRRLALIAGAGALAAAVVTPASGASPRPHVELLRTGFTMAGEPNIGIDRGGVIFSDVMGTVVKSSDHGRHWVDVSPPGHLTTLDPYLYVDKATGRVFKSDLAGTCQLLSWSDNRGQSWTADPAACNLSDHQSISAGPPTTAAPTVGYPNVVYDCSQTLGYNGYSFGSGCDRSLDGGLTWSPTGTLPFNDPSPYGAAADSGDSGVPGVCNGDIGPIHAAPDGTLYVPRGWCGQPWLAISHDSGATWMRTQVAANGMNTTLSGGFGIVAPGSGQSDYQASVMADKAGNVFFSWIAKNRMPYLAVSRDYGKTFGKPVSLAPKGLREAWGPAVDLDAAGRLAFAYMGSTDSPGAPFTGSYSGATFTGYLGLVSAPLSAKPKMLTAPITPKDAPLVNGACGPDRCNAAVLDFIDVALAPDGSVFGAFVDAARSSHELVIGHLTAS